MTKDLNVHLDILGLVGETPSSLTENKIKKAFRKLSLVCHPDKYSLSQCPRAKTEDEYQEFFTKMGASYNALLEEISTSGKDLSKIPTAQETALTAKEIAEATAWAKEALAAVTKVTTPSAKLEKSIEELEKAEESLRKAEEDILNCSTDTADCDTAETKAQKAADLVIEAANLVTAEATALVDSHSHTHKIIETYLHHVNYEGDITLLGDTIAIFKAAGWDFV